MSRKKIITIILGGSILLAITLTIALVLSYKQASNIRTTSQWVAHTENVIRSIQQLQILALENETSARGYVLSTDSAHFNMLRRSDSAFYISSREVALLLSDNKDQLFLLDSLNVLANQRLEFSFLMARVRDQYGLDSAVGLVSTGRGKALTNGILTLGKRMQEREMDILEVRKEANEKSVRTLANALYILLFVFSTAAVFFLIQLIKNLRRQDENEQKFKALLDSAPDATVIVDAGGKIVMINDQTERLFGYTRTEILGQQVEILMPDALRTKHVRTRNEYLHHPRVRSMGAGIELFAVRKGGDVFPVEISLSPIHTKDGQLVSASVRDITEQKKIAQRLHSLNTELEEKVKQRTEELMAGERRFKALIENIGDGIVMNDDTLQIIYQSPSVDRILGYNLEERKGTRVLDYVHPDDKEIFLDFYQTVRDNPGNSRSFEYRFRHKSGKFIWLQGVVTNLLHDPKVGAYVSNYRDITIQKEIQARIEQLNEELEIKVQLRTDELKTANEELEAFSYSVSHDLRAPLRAISGFTTILEEDYGSKLDEEALRIMGIIRSNSQQMGLLIDDLLQFSRTSRKELVKTNVDMEKLVAEVWEDLAGSHSGTKIDFKMSDVPMAKVDLNSMRQVWVNLISNAIKYSGKKENPVISIGGHTDQSMLVYWIRDNGVGFDMKYYDKLFKVFQRLHSMNEYDGTGVGLALADKIISKHDGRIWAVGKPGQGATFYFSVPLI